MIRQPFPASDLLPNWVLGRFGGNHLYKLAEDPSEERNFTQTRIGKQLEEKPYSAPLEIEAPKDQLVRMGPG
ncbi:MAG: hypothetical protein ACREQB_04290 [Candidatus Binataceae bacterium]